MEYKTVQHELEYQLYKVQNEPNCERPTEAEGAANGTTANARRDERESVGVYQTTPGEARQDPSAV